MSGAVIAVTGATGFVGRHLVPDLLARGHRVRALLRADAPLPPGVEGAVVGDLTRPAGLEAALEGVDAVVHAAGLAHATAGLGEEVYRAINTDATLALARAARAAGARRFVYLSSIKAQTAASADGVLTEADPPRPVDAYGRSKLAAERGLAEVGLDWAALRPVLVYGAGVKGNMAGLLRIARLPVPLPFGGLRARRSLLAVENLTGAIALALARPVSFDRALVVADPEALTLPDMVAALREGLGRRPGLLPLPEPWLRAALRAAGRGEAADRLAGALVASPAALLSSGWVPRTGTRAGLAALARSSAPGA